MRRTLDGRLPRSRDFGDFLLLLDELEGDRRAAKVEENEHEQREVAHVDGEVKQVDELLLRVDLQEIVREVEHGLRLGEQLGELELLEDVLIVEVDVHLL